MPHVRKQIRDAAAAQITGLTTTTDHVYKSRVRPTNEDLLPCWLVNTNGEDVEAMTVHTNPPLQRDLQLEFRAVAQGTDGAVDDTLDQMALELEIALAGSTLGNLVKQMTLSRVDTEYSAEGSKVLGIMTLTYGAEYNTLANAPGTPV